MTITACITIKDRAENLKKCVASLEAAGIDEIVVSDFCSRDTDFEWFKHRLVTIEGEHFSVGRGKNVAAENATGDILFFIDADLTVPESIKGHINAAIERDKVFAPIMQMQNEDGTLGEWAVHSYGQVALLKKDFDSGEKWQPWTSYGGEDNLFIAQYQHRLVRDMIVGFIHQWHAHELREANGESPAYTDLKKFDKEFKPMKIYAHDPRFVFNGRYNSFPDSVVVREIWCENVYEVFDGDLTDTGIVVDIGANIGSFSMYAASLGAKKVIAVEPQTDNLELLRQNIDKNKQHVPDCEFIVDERAILGETPPRTGLGSADVRTYVVNNAHGDSEVMTLKEARERSMNEYAEVQGVSLQQLWKDHNLEFVDILKIDIEGLEGEVILGAPTELLNLCRYITMEYDEDADDLGVIVEKISKTHQIKYVGAHGGMLFGKRY